MEGLLDKLAHKYCKDKSVMLQELPLEVLDLHLTVRNLIAFKKKILKLLPRLFHDKLSQLRCLDEVLALRIAHSIHSVQSDLILARVSVEKAFLNHLPQQILHLLRLAV